jgi:NADH-quinone oxidoreductase subunit E
MVKENKPTYQTLQNEQHIPTNVVGKTDVELSAAARAHIDQWTQRYPAEQKRSAIFAALTYVQEENGGHLTAGLMAAVATHLELPAIAAYEVAAFYSMYELDPVGKHVIHLCTNISCSLNGAEELLTHLKQRLNVDLDETTTDRRFTLKEIECLGACVAAPVCMIDKTYHEKLTKEKLDALLAQYSLLSEAAHGK